MTKRHLKTINAPRSWPVERKSRYWVSRPNPGLPLKESLPLNVIFKDLLKYVKTVRELNKILNQGIIKVNGVVRKDYKFSLGVFDVLELSNGECYRLLYNLRGRFYLSEIKKDEKKTELLKVNDKKILKKNKVQLNFTNGHNLLTDKKEIKTGDTVVLEDKKVKGFVEFDKGVMVYLIGGKHIGMIGKVKKIEGNRVVFSVKDKDYETLKKYAFVIGKDKPLITIKDE